MILLFSLLFWVSALTLFHIYVGYPLLIRWLSRTFGQSTRKAPYPGRCSIVISAHNEVESLPPKLSRLLQGPNNELIAEILIGSDGSTDGTEQALQELRDARIKVHHFAERQGKASVINTLVPTAQSDIVVLTDARQPLSDGALAALLSNFADPLIGVVSGELIFQDPDDSSTGKGMDAYWRYEKSIRKAEAGFRSVPGATGALYALRRNLFEPIDPNLLLDDVGIPMQVVLKGYRCVFEPLAVVYDRPSASGKAEAIRKRRTIAGNVQLVAKMPDLIKPWRNPIWFEFVSHKLLRLMSPFCLLLTFCVSGYLAIGRGAACDSSWFMIFFRAVFGLHALLLLLAFGNVFFVGRLFSAAAMFLRLNWITLLAWGDALQGRFNINWQRST